MFKIKIIGIVCLIFCLIVGYFYFSKKILSNNLEKAKREIVEIESKKDIEVFESRWRAIAQEHNNSLTHQNIGDKNESMVDYSDDGKHITITF